MPSTGSRTELLAHGYTVVKVMLHISYDEQRQRLLERLTDPTKRWKFNPGDLDDRRRWPDYQVAYEEAIAGAPSTVPAGTWCRPTGSGTGTGPWRIIVLAAFDSMKLTYPDRGTGHRQIPQTTRIRQRLGCSRRKT